jgi:L-rhamnose mutarotase
MMDTHKADRLYGVTNPQISEDGVRRFGSVIGLKPEMEARYRELHANAWDPVIACLTKNHIRNYSIFITELEGKRVLFSYMEYTGSDYEKDMRAVAADPETQRWWRETDPCQIQLPGREPGAKWSAMERVFFMK